MPAAVRTRRRSPIQPDDLAGVLHIIAVNITDDGRFSRCAYAPAGLFKVGVDPQIGGRHHRHQRRGQANLGAGLHGTTGNVAANRADDLRTLQRKPSVTDIRRRLQNRRLLLRAGIQHDSPVGVELLNGDIQLGLGAGDGITSVLQLFAANQVGGAQRDTTVEVGLCLKARFS